MEETEALLPVERVVARIKATYGRWDRSTDVADMRRDWDAMFSGPTVEHSFQPVSAGGVPAAWIRSPGADPNRVVVYFHGGGFRLGSIASHRGLMARLSAASGCSLLGVAYRLAPEHHFPAPIEDALKVLDWLLPQVGDTNRIGLAGDSAGGGLALATLLSLRDSGRPLPAACVLFSPWTDLAATGASYATRAGRDPIHQRPMILAMAKSYLGPAGDPRAPLASPLYADLAGLSPVFIQVGDRETVLDDSRDFARRAEEAGVPVELQVWDEMIHVFQLFADDLPEARQAIASAGEFLRGRLAPVVGLSMPPIPPPLPPP
jgi:acetyl esterase/lipase